MAALSSEIALGGLEEGDTFVFANILCTRGKELRVIGRVGKGGEKVYYQAVEYTTQDDITISTLPASAMVVPIH